VAHMIHKAHGSHESHSRYATGSSQPFHKIEASDLMQQFFFAFGYSTFNYRVMAGCEWRCYAEVYPSF
jgi:hypothetical protein